MSISIKILGTGCPKCKQTTALVQEVVNENNIIATIEKVEDIMEIMNYEVMSTPAIVVNEVVKIKGRVPSKEEILEILTGKLNIKNEKEAGDCCSGTSCC
jgi:small redox-active disulfide protein 2